MTLSRTLTGEIRRSNRKLSIEKVPEDRQPRSAVLEQLQREISAQVAVNEFVAERSAKR